MENNVVDSCPFTFNEGDSFNTFDDFLCVLKARTEITNEHFVKASGNVTVNRANKRLKKAPYYHPDLGYVMVTMRCVHEGEFHSLGFLKLSTTSKRSNCPVRIKLKFSKKLRKLVVDEVCLEHSHPIYQNPNIPKVTRAVTRKRKPHFENLTDNPKSIEPSPFSLKTLANRALITNPSLPLSEEFTMSNALDISPVNESRWSNNESDMKPDLSGLPIVYMSRIESFSACHRLNSVHLSAEANEDLYGQCNWMNGHGHNYKVEVTLRGPVDPITGMVMNISDLKLYIQEGIMSVLDHKNVDKDVPYFKENVSTMENIAVFIFESMRKRIGNLLYEIKVHETDKNVAWYRGELSN